MPLLQASFDSVFISSFYASTSSEPTNRHDHALWLLFLLWDYSASITAEPSWPTSGLCCHKPHAGQAGYRATSPCLREPAVVLKRLIPLLRVRLSDFQIIAVLYTATRWACSPALQCAAAFRGTPSSTVIANMPPLQAFPLDSAAVTSADSLLL